MIIELMNHQNKKVTFDIGNIEDIKTIDIEVKSGDEIAYIMYNDERLWVRFDSSLGRKHRQYEFTYPVYSEFFGINLLTDKRFLDRETSRHIPCGWKLLNF